MSSNLFGKVADKPFSHPGDHGTKIFSASCDFKGGLFVYRPDDTTPEEMAVDLAAAVAYHALVIHKDLNGFSGYHRNVFTFIGEKECQERMAEYNITC
jgi:hypothetical protein